MPTGYTVRMPTLEIGYEAYGDASGVPIVLLHGFPDDARAWATSAVHFLAVALGVYLGCDNRARRATAEHDRAGDEERCRDADEAAGHERVGAYAGEMEVQRWIVRGGEDRRHAAVASTRRVLETIARKDRRVCDRALPIEDRRAESDRRGNLRRRPDRSA